MNIKLLSLISVSMVLSSCGNSTSTTKQKLVEITINNQPSKTAYVVGDYFEPLGLSISAIYNKGKKEIISYDGNEDLFKFIPSLDTQLQVTDQYVVVEYKEFTTTIDISVTEPATETFTVDFSTLALGDTNILQSSDSTFKEKTMSFINENVNDLLSDINYPNQNEIRFKKDDFPGEFADPQALILGSQNYDGYLEMTFTKTIKSVKIKAQQYYNLIKGYGDDQNIYPSYDCQLWDDELSDYIGDPNSSLIVNEQEMHINAITYEYEDDGYTPIPSVPPICESTLTINNNTLELEALASYRIRVFELQITFID